MAEDHNTTSEKANGLAMLGVVLFAVFFLFWYFWGDEVKNVFRYYRWVEIWALATIADFLPFLIDPDYAVERNGIPITLQQGVDEVLLIPSHELTSEIFGAVSLLAMQPLKWPMAIILGFMALWAYRNGPGTEFRRKLNLDGLLATQAKVFPVLTPFVSFNPSDMPPRPPGAPVPAELPLFSEALGPEEWLAFNQIPIPDGEIDRDAAYIAFARQLGPRWKGAMRLAPYKQVFLAMCCLRASRKRVEADDMAGRLACCWSHDKGLRLGQDKSLLKEARRILRNKDLSRTVLASANQHAFQTTALIRALSTAREEGGVMAPPQFVWLRGHDRALWYPLNNLGRQALHMEALGAMSHYKLEKRTQRPIPKPKVDDAIQSITEYMTSDKARPIPQLDYSGSKKRGVKKLKKKK